jgi:SAM-dependent methyltransferase
MSSSGFKCHSCSGSHHEMVLDLGLQPLANNLLRPEDLAKPEPKFPLRLAVCTDCWLLQITDLVPPVELFSEYLYFSSFSDTMLRHAKEAATRYIQEFKLDQNSLVVEIASNDGYLLKNFVETKIPCLGIEPAGNIAKVAREKGIETLVEFFTESLAAQLVGQGRQADLILGNTVFAHAPDTNDFVAAAKKLLKPKGRIAFEFPYAFEMLAHNEFDTIYHEHVFYFSLTALQPLFARHGLEIFAVEHLPIHGGSLRLFAGHRSAHALQSSVAKLLAEEAARGVSTLTPYRAFAQRAHQLRDNLNALVKDLRSQGKRLAAYGASAKGSTLLNFCRLNHTQLEFVADRSTYKQGRLTPGTHIPITSPEALEQKLPDYTLLLTWNFAEEILRQQKSYRDRGGKFIIPIPEVKVA